MLYSKYSFGVEAFNLLELTRGQVLGSKGIDLSNYFNILGLIMFIALFHYWLNFLGLRYLKRVQDVVW
jgi:amino acid transporter